MKYYKKVFVFSLFVVFFIYTIYIPYKNYRINKYIELVNDISEDMDYLILSSNAGTGSSSRKFLGELTYLSGENSIDVSTWMWETIIKNVVLDEFSDIDDVIENFDNTLYSTWGNKSIVKFQKLYLSAIKRKNKKTAIRAIAYILEIIPKDIDYLVKIIQLNVQIGEFKEALKWNEKLLKLSQKKDYIDSYIFLRIQTMAYENKNQIKEFDKQIKLLYEQSYISFDDYSFYSFILLLVSNWDREKLTNSINNLSNTMWTWWKLNLINDIKHSLWQYEELQETPLYYFKALVSFHFFNYSYFWLANKIASDVYLENDSYILPIQILAYSNFFMWNYSKALNWFNKLKEIDTLNEGMYNYFLWVNYFWDWKNEDSLLYLSQVDEKNEELYKDVLRYKFLNYRNMKNKKYIKEVIYEMIDYKLSYVDYYNFFKYFFIQCDDCVHMEKDSIIKLIVKCYADTTDEDRYVCWYGKSNLYYNLGQHDLAVKYYEPLTNYFKDYYIFERVGDWYVDKIPSKAQKHYVSAYIYASKFSDRERIKNKLKELLKK